MLLPGIVVSAAEAANRATIDVLMVFDRSSQKSLREDGGRFGISLQPMSPEQAAELAITQLNQVMVASGIGDKVYFRNAGIHLSNYTTVTQMDGEDPRFGDDDIQAMRKGKVQGLNEAREKNKADLVVMFTAYPLSGGNAVIGGALPIELTNLYLSQDNINERKAVVGPAEGFAAVFHETTIRRHDSTFSHEVCHLLGAGHSDSQLAQCGPQAELDAAGTYTSDDTYASLMSYKDRIDISGAPTPRFSRQLDILSHPGTVELKSGKYKLGDADYHNNAAVCLRHASAVASYRQSGNEKAVNDNLREALPMPRLLPFKEKFRHLLRGHFFWDINSGLLPIKVLISNGVPRSQITPSLIQKTQQELLENREQLLNLLVAEPTNDYCTEYIAPEFLANGLEGICYSCTMGTTSAATRENGEPQLPGGCGNTVWYKVTTPEAGNLEVGIRKAGTTPNFEPVLGIFRGKQVGRLKPVPHQNVQSSTSTAFLKCIEANVDKGEELYIAVDSRSSGRNWFNLVVCHRMGAYTGPPIAPPSEEEAEEPQPPNGGGNWDVLDTLLLLLCFLMLVCCIVMGYMLWQEKQKINSPITGNGFKMPILPPAPTPAAAPQPAQHAHLSIVGTLSDGRNKSFSIDVNDIAAHHNFYIGSASPQSHFVIPDATISRRHAVLKLRKDGHGFMLLMGDAGSTNGTYIEGRRVSNGDCIKVRQNMRVQLGNCHFTISYHSK